MSMNVCKEQVRHPQFGIGVVTEQAETHITVQFCDKYGAKKFPYPSTFTSFLTLCNPETQEKMAEELRLIQQAADNVRREHEQTMLQRETEQLAAQKPKRAAPKKRAPAKTAAEKLPAEAKA